MIFCVEVSLVSNSSGMNRHEKDVNICKRIIQKRAFCVKFLLGKYTHDTKKFTYKDELAQQYIS